MHRIVVIGRDGLAVEGLEVEYSHGLVRLAVIVGTLPPGPALGIEEVALDIEVTDAVADSYLGRNHVLVCLLDGLVHPLGQFVCRYGASGMAVGAVVDDIALRDAEILLDAFVDGIDTTLVGVAVNVGQAGDGGAVREEDHTEVGMVEDSIRITAELVRTRGDVHFSGADFQLATDMVACKGAAREEQCKTDHNQRFCFHDIIKFQCYSYSGMAPLREQT